jgi:hypothetical protein
VGQPQPAGNTLVPADEVAEGGVAHLLLDDPLILARSNSYPSKGSISHEILPRISVRHLRRLVLRGELRTFDIGTGDYPVPRFDPRSVSAFLTRRSFPK